MVEVWFVRELYVVEFVVLLIRVLFDIEVEFVRRVLVVGVAVVWLLMPTVLVVELTTVDVDVVFFAIMTVPDVVLLAAVELLVVDAFSWLVEVDVVAVPTRVDELVAVEPVLAIELTVASVVGALEVSLVREVELAAV